MSDPLAGYRPDWRQRGTSTPAEPTDPLSGYDPHWRERVTLPTAPAINVAPPPDRVGPAILANLEAARRREPLPSPRVPGVPADASSTQRPRFESEIARDVAGGRSPTSIGPAPDANDQTAQFARQEAERVARARAERSVGYTGGATSSAATFEGIANALLPGQPATRVVEAIRGGPGFIEEQEQNRKAAALVGRTPSAVEQATYLAGAYPGFAGAGRIARPIARVLPGMADAVRATEAIQESAAPLRGFSAIAARAAAAVPRQTIDLAADLGASEMAQTPPSEGVTGVVGRGVHGVASAPVTAAMFSPLHAIGEFAQPGAVSQLRRPPMPAQEALADFPRPAQTPLYRPDSPIPAEREMALILGNTPRLVYRGEAVNPYQPTAPEHGWWESQASRAKPIYQADADARLAQAGAERTPDGDILVRGERAQEAIDYRGEMARRVPPIVTEPEIPPAATESAAPTPPSAAPPPAAQPAPVEPSVRVPTPGEEIAPPPEIPPFMQGTGAPKPEPVVDPVAAAEAAAIARQRAELEITDPEKQGRGPAWQAPRGVVSMSRADITLAPDEMQWRDNAGAGGGTGRLRDVKTWNQDLADPLAVWRDPSTGQTKLIDGHNRIEAYDRIQPGVPLDVRFIEAETAQEARAKGALLNVGRGNAEPLDIARVLRELKVTPEELSDFGVPIGRAATRQGMALANLAPDIFEQVSTGKLSEDAGVAIGEVLSGEPEMQREARGFVQASKKRLTGAEVRGIAALVRTAGTETVKQETLFGTEEERRGLVEPKARLGAAWLQRVNADKRLFGYVAKEGRAEELARAGNAIDVEGSKALAEQSARVEEIFNRLYSRSGPLATVLDEGARRIARGQKVGAVATELYPRVVDAISAEVAGGGASASVGVSGSPGLEGSGASGAEGASSPSEGVAPPPFVDPSQDALFSPSRPTPSARDLSKEPISVQGEYPEVVRAFSESPAAGKKQLRASLRSMTPETAARLSALLEQDGVASATTPAKPKRLDRADINSMTDLAVRRAAAESRRLYIYPTAKGYAIETQVPPTSGAIHVVEPGGRVLLREPVLDGNGGWKETVVRENPAKSSVPVSGAPAAKATAPLAPAPVAPTEAPAKPPTPPDVTAVSGLPEPVSLAGGGERPALSLTSEEATPAQGSLLGDREGTAAARNLAQTEAAARSELEVLRERFKGETDPARRAELATEIADREKLVNRDKAISPEELATRAAAEAQARTERHVTRAEDAGRAIEAARLKKLLERADLPEEHRGDIEDRVTDLVGETVDETPEPDVPHEVADRTVPEQIALLSPATSARVKKAAGVTPANVADARALVQISRSLAEAVGVPLRQGRFNAAARKAAGVFKPHEEVTRVLRFDKLDTVAHEVGHYISKKWLRNPTMQGAAARGVPKMPATALRELVQMGRDLYGARVPNGGYGEEGIAEWASFYVTEPHTLTTKAPVFTAHMDAVLQHEPMLKAALDQARADFERFQQAPAERKVEAMIARTVPYAMPNVRTLVRLFTDDLYEFKVAMRALGDSQSPGHDAYVLARLTRGSAGAAEEMLDRGVARWKGNSLTRIGPSITEALRSVGMKRLAEFERYLTAESALERHENGIDPGVAKAEAQEIADAGRANPVFAQAAESIWKHYNALIDLRVDVGLLTPEEGARIKDKNKRHVAFYREFAPEETAASKGRGKAFSRAGSGVKRQTGSARRILPPLESLVKDTHDTVTQVNRYRVARELIRASINKEGGGHLIEEVPAPTRLLNIPADRMRDQLANLGLVQEITNAKTGLRETVPLQDGDGLTGQLLRHLTELPTAGAKESKDLVIPFLDKGDRRWFQIKDKQLYDAMLGLGTPEMSSLMRWLSFPTRTLRTGATLALEFAARNPVKDAWHAAVFSRSTKPVMIGHHLTEGLFHVLKADDVFQRWKLEGGENSSMAGLDRPEIRRHVEEIAGSDTALGSLVTLVRHPIDTLRMISSLSENATRVAEFAITERQMLKKAVAPEDAAAQATLNARDVTLDFNKSGTVTRSANQIVAFLNAWKEGQAQMLRDLKARPEVIVPRALAWVSMPSIGLYLAQKDDPIYRDVPQFRKDAAWVIVQRGIDRGEGWDNYGTGKPEHVWYIPKPLEIGVLFGSVPEHIADWIHTKDPEALRSVTTALSKGFAPPYIPTFAAPLIENWANKSTWRDRPIVPRSREELDPAEQYSERTGETARTIGSAIGYSPAKVENVIRGYTGGLGGYALSASDAAVRGARSAMGKPPLKPPAAEHPDPLGRIPGLRGFIGREPGSDAESIARVYRQFDEAERLRRTWRAMLREGRNDDAAKYLEQHREQIGQVVTTEEAGEPGPLRVAYQELQQAQEARRMARGTTAERDVTDAMRRIGQIASPR